MAEPLGKIEKPAAQEFEQQKKLFLVPLLYVNQDAPPDYKEKVERYWQQAAEHVANLERKVGSVSRVYHESVTQSGKEGLELLEKLNSGSYQMVKQRCEQGASLEPIEQREMVEEVMDWERCLMIGFVSQKVANQVLESYREASKKRNEFMLQRIQETLHAREAGILFIREGHALQFGKDVEVFSVYPPALDEFHRFLRDRRREAEKSEEGEQGTERESEQEQEATEEKQGE